MSKTLLKASELNHVIKKLATELCRMKGDFSKLVLIGIRTRGAVIAQRLQKIIREIRGQTLPVGLLDITLYRDDLTSVASQPVVRRTELPFSIEGRGVVLVDDVLFTGRTVRAALDALIDFGRPAFIRLLCVMDRGLREVPIQADFVGKSIQTKVGQDVQVHLTEIDGDDSVILI